MDYWQLKEVLALTIAAVPGTAGDTALNNWTRDQLTAHSKCGLEEKIIQQQIQATVEAACHLGHTSRQRLE